MRRAEYQLAKHFRYLDVFFEVTSTKFATAPVREWVWSDKKCPACYWISAHWRPKPIDVEVPELPRGVGGLLLVGLAAYRTLLLRQLSAFNQDCVLGTCHVSGALGTNDDYQTIYSLNPIVVRSSPPKQLEPKYEECPVCRTVACISAQSPKCIVPQDIQGREILQRKSGVLLLSKRLVDAIDWSGMSDASLEPVYVVDAPFDGHRLSHDPPWKG